MPDRRRARRASIEAVRIARDAIGDPADLRAQSREELSAQSRNAEITQTALHRIRHATAAEEMIRHRGQRHAFEQGALVGGEILVAVPLRVQAVHQVVHHLIHAGDHQAVSQPHRIVREQRIGAGQAVGQPVEHRGPGGLAQSRGRAGTRARFVHQQMRQAHHRQSLVALADVEDGLLWIEIGELVRGGEQEQRRGDGLPGAELPQGRIPGERIVKIHHIQPRPLRAGAIRLTAAVVIGGEADAGGKTPVHIIKIRLVEIMFPGLLPAKNIRLARTRPAAGQKYLRHSRCAVGPRAGVQMHLHIREEGHVQLAREVQITVGRERQVVGREIRRRNRRERPVARTGRAGEPELRRQLEA